LNELETIEHAQRLFVDKQLHDKRSARTVRTHGTDTSVDLMIDD
jgi:hypothetical protein